MTTRKVLILALLLAFIPVSVGAADFLSVDNILNAIFNGTDAIKVTQAGVGANTTRAVNRETVGTGQAMVWNLPFSDTAYVAIANNSTSSTVTFAFDATATGSGTNEIKLGPQGSYDGNYQVSGVISVYAETTAEVSIEIMK